MYACVYEIRGNLNKSVFNNKHQQERKKKMPLDYGDMLTGKYKQSRTEALSLSRLVERTNKPEKERLTQNKNHNQQQQRQRKKIMIITI